MRKRNYIIYILPIFINTAWGQTWIDESLDLFINTRFNEAESLYTSHIAQGDSALEVWFYYASMLNSKITHYENEVDGDKYMQILNKVIDRAEKQLGECEQSDSTTLALLKFYRGSAYGYLAFYQGQTGQWFAAMKNGMKTFDDLNEALQYDSLLYDAYLGIGVYKYWKSTKLKAVLWLPFVEDRREEGIEDIRIAIVNRCRSRYLAMHQAIYILCNDGRFDEAHAYARQVIDTYPQSQFMRWAHAHSYFKSRDYNKAIPSYKILLQLIEDDNQSNRNHYLEVCAMTAELYKRLGQQDSCRVYSRKAIETRLDYLSNKGEVSLEKARTLLLECSE